MTDRQPEASQTATETARKNETAILNRLSSVGQNHIAEALDTSEGTISKWKSNGDIERFARMLAHLDLKVVPTAHLMMDPARHRALMLLAQDGIAAHQAALDGDGR